MKGRDGLDAELDNNLQSVLEGLSEALHRIEQPSIKKAETIKDSGFPYNDFKPFSALLNETNTKLTSLHHCKRTIDEVWNKLSRLE